MEAVEQPETAEELRLLLNWTTDADQARTRRAGVFSIAAHAVAVVLLLLMPRQVFQTAPAAHRVTPLIAPPTELTQTTPNRGKISKEFNVEALRPKPRIQVPPSPPSTSRPKAPALSTPAPKPAQPAALPEPPKIEAANKDNGPKLPEGVRVGGADEAVGGGEIGGNGLFNQDVDAGFEERAGDIGVGGGGDGNDGGVDFSGELAGISEGEARIGSGDFGGAGGVGVDDGDERGAGRLARYADMVAAEFADADDGYAGVRHTSSSTPGHGGR